MVDELLGEIQNMNELSKEQKEQLAVHSNELSSVQEKLEDLEAMKEAMSEMANKSVSAQSLKELQDKLDSLKTDTEGLKVSIQTDICICNRSDMLG